MISLTHDTIMNSSSFYNKPDKTALKNEYVGRKLRDLPTPSVIIDRQKFASNSAKMLQSAQRLAASFRCHIKTHKTMEGVELQLGYGAGLGDSTPKSSKIVVSTLAEAWGVLPLVHSGKIDDVLYGLPVAKLRIPELHALLKEIKLLRVMVDSEAQIEHLAEFGHANDYKWSVFIKVDMGTKRAGLTEDSYEFKSLIRKLSTREIAGAVEIYGLYCHAGHSYGSKGNEDAREFLLQEIKHANHAAKIVKNFLDVPSLVISAGATPTAHSSQEFGLIAEIEQQLGESLVGKLELHAGNYPCCDLQQVATGMVKECDVSLFLLAEILGLYKGRNGRAPGEQLINAGAIALSREAGPLPGHGKVVKPTEYGSWYVGKVSQEHGILFPQEGCTFMPYGEKVLILPQHACITASAHGWYFIIEDDVVVDIWVPSKLW